MKKERLEDEKESRFFKQFIFQRFIKMTKKEVKAYEAGMRSSGVFTDIGIRLDMKNKDGRWVEVILYQKKEVEKHAKAKRNLL